MLRFFVSRFLQALLAIFVIITATFFMSRAVPGGPFDSEKATTPEVKRNIEAHYHLNDPLWKQYTDYLWNICPKKLNPAPLADSLDLKAAFGMDFGPSYRYFNRTVNEVIAEKLPVSLELGAISLSLAFLIGLPLGIIAALRRNTWVDYLSSSFGMAGICIPTFVVGPLLVLIFAIHLRWFNASGWEMFSDRVLPSIVLGLAYAAPISRLTRTGMLDVFNQDFIRTARAKGASDLRIVFKHSLRGGLLPVVAYLGPAAAGILTGSFVIETIFQIPGFGREFVTSVQNLDYTLIIGAVIVFAAMLMTLNLIVDVAQAWMNPKVRLES